MAQSDQRLANWIERYERAWGSNEPNDISALFSPDARYKTAPYREPWKGRELIVKEWLDRKDTPGNWEFRYHLSGFLGEFGVVRGWTKYKEPPETYHNLWFVKLEPDGTCSEFTEWWMLEEPPKE